ncbi:hypothetical protein EFM20_02815 [Lactiplantibacillus plantarum]|nr:hypothetical protein [Lactiplantibacillus plantarum]
MITKYHKGRHSLFLYNSEIFYAFTQDILYSHKLTSSFSMRIKNPKFITNISHKHGNKPSNYITNLVEQM